MPRLIHLNGPPGIGKSTLAARYVACRPGLLNLDIDQLRQLIGGWRERFAETGGIVRPIALGMVETHLAGGRDVMLPQYLGDVGEVERFERVARDTDSEFREIVLMDRRDRAVDRFYDRGRGGDDSWHEQVKRIVEADGGRPTLEAMYDRLSEVVAARPGALVIDSIPDGIDQTYDAIVSALDP